MDEPWGLLVLLGVAVVLCGPVALVVSLVALSRIREMQRQIEAPPGPASGGSPRRRPAPPDADSFLPLPEVGSPAPGETVGTAPTPPSVRVESSGGGPSTPATSAAPVLRHTAPSPRRESLALEQRIGTRWVLVAGVITIVFAVGFFLKYAYESGWIGPLGRVLIAGAGGLLALTIGELTRRRGYDFVAKGVTALGFAILYATVFAAHRWYGLLGPAPAYVLAVGDHRGGHALRGRPGRSHRGRAVADRRLHHARRAVPGREPADLAVQLRPDSQRRRGALCVLAQVELRQYPGLSRDVPAVHRLVGAVLPARPGARR